ncbi:MAG TPA: hypothetical protein VKC60_10805 [Opitutaceae bacterium]|nr:hypothetical protein [Opitutaceae bacterium]
MAGRRVLATAFRDFNVRLPNSRRRDATAHRIRINSKWYCISSWVLLIACFSVSLGCTKKVEVAVLPIVPEKHEHAAPHGGTLVVLGEETYHLEFVRDSVEGKMTVYVFDGELDNFIRSSSRVVTVQASFERSAQMITSENPAKQGSLWLDLNAVANPATGESIGDTAMFEAQGDWLKSVSQFDGLIESVAIRGRTFTDVKFNFPRGSGKE